MSAVRTENNSITADRRKLKIVVVGHVDHGKSTLIGRIFFDTDSMPEGKIEAIRKASEAEGMPFEYAFLLDALLEEQEQNITIDTTQIPFRTAKREYVIIDAPGHKEFLKNMITGAASADAAVLLIAASEGVREQSRRHGYLLKLLGVRQVVVAVNKMDLVGYDEATFRRVVAEYREFLEKIGLAAERFVPISAREGDNIAARATETMPWYDGPTMLETLDAFDSSVDADDLPLRLPIQDVYRFDARRILVGRIETGVLRVGDSLVFQPGDRRSTVAQFERWHGPDRDFAVAGESVALTLTEQIFAERGQIATTARAGMPPRTGMGFSASLFWMGPGDLSVGERVRLKLATQEVTARVARVERLLDASTLETQEVRSHLARNDVAEVLIETERPIAFDLHDEVPTLGRFVLVHQRRVAGGGIITGVRTDDAARTASTPGSSSARNLVAVDSRVTFEERARRNGHRGGVLWLTGLSGSGKSTIAATVHRALFDAGWQVTLLDGDNLRHGLCADLGFSPEDRAENIRRAAQVARLFAESGLVVLTALISPYRSDRAAARDVLQQGGIDFFEVFVDAPLEVCEERDPKGLYRRARAGEIREFTGISSPYEPPVAPDIVLPTARQSVEESARALIDEIESQLRFQK
ncbi:MAG: adenylyl-sulfate kinase [Capsulimonadales bacterium]|nr:adenylyl-sulfate kinase [Capsulimonadales bacterium]